MDEALDLDALRASVRDVLDIESGSDTVLRHHKAGMVMHADLWTTASELGWLSLSIPEEQGGLGLGLDALATLYRELGRVVAPLPILATLLAADALTRGGGTAWLRPIATGETPAAVALNAELTATADGDSLLLGGTSDLILDGLAAKVFVVRAYGDQGAVWAVLEAGDAGLIVEPVAAADRTRSLARLHLNDVRVPVGRRLSLAENALDIHAALGIASDSLGGGEAILATTIAYLKTREQFGKPIGSFQALKHRVADHQAGLMVAGAALDDVVARAGTHTLSLADALAAKAHCTAIVGAVARDCIQLHGGIGFTSEYIAHVYLKRALLNEAMFGTMAQTLDRVTLALAA